MIPIFFPRSLFFVGQIQIFHFNCVAGLDNLIAIPSRDVSCLKKSSVVEINPSMPVGLQNKLMISRSYII